MATAVETNDLLALARLLQERLNSELPLVVPIQVKCVLQDGNLLVLGQDASRDEQTEPIFSLLQDSIEALQITFPGSIWEETQQVCLYLRASGERQPFAAREFQLEKSPVAKGLEKEVSSTPFVWDNSAANIFNWEPEESAIESFELDSDRSLEAEKHHLDRDLNSPPAAVSNVMESLSLEEPVPESKSEPNSIPAEQIPPPKADRPRPKKLSPLMLNLGAGVAAIGVLGGIYVLTRPCVIGQCSAIASAKELDTASIQAFRNAKNEQDIWKGRQLLTKATQELSSIPFWSKYHSNAQKILPTYKSKIANVDPVLIALNKAEVATEKSQIDLQTIQDLQASRQTWQQAIASLNRVSRNAPLYSLAQQKIKEYQGKLAATNYKYNLENQGETKLTIAKKTAQLAQVRQEAAKTLNHWQQVEATWEAAINSLRAVSPNTNAYQEAKQLMDNYNSSLARTRQRKSQEELAVTIYNQAIDIANLAKSYEQKSQWTQALSTWRRASTYIQQIPENTFYYEKAKPISDRYNNSLRIARGKLQIAVVMQKASADLNKICAGAPRICDNTVTFEKLKVYLTPAYVNGVRRTAMTAGLSGDAKTLAGVDDHLKTLQLALEAISENSGIPIEIYDNRRVLIGRYVPKQIANQ